MKSCTITLVLALLFYAVNGQKMPAPAAGMYPQYLDFYDSPPNYNHNILLYEGKKLNSVPIEEHQLISAEIDQLGFTHYRVNQMHQGYPVVDAQYIAHVKNGKLTYQNGEWVKTFPDNLSTKPTLTDLEALQKAMNFINAKEYMWEDLKEEQEIKNIKSDLHATYYPKTELVYFSGSNTIVPTALRLCYKMNVYAKQPLSHQTIFIDAVTGAVVGTRDLIHTNNVVGTAVTAYSGNQSITTSYDGVSYKLQSTTRGNGVNTYDMRTAGTDYYNVSNFLDNDNVWNNVNANLDQYATDAHWGAEKTYDYFFTKFGRNSIDNNGFALNSFVHVDLTLRGYPNNVNAFWDGARMSYGDGNGSNITPLTSIDIAGHEITHGLTSRTSNLTYSGESGALNEAFSDIFGTCIEFFGKPGNWTLGEDIGLPFRNLSNPNAFSDPDTYRGNYWVTGSQDNYGVHTNSGVLNYWFYLLTAGGSGTNDNGYAYNVTGIGMEKSGAIAYRTNVYYLTPSSNYANARTYSLQAATDLYGANSNEVSTASCAWAAVGVGSCIPVVQPCNAPTNLTTTNVTTNSAQLNWSAAANAVSYTVEYRNNGTTVWTTAATNVTTTSYQLSGLSHTTNYTWRVTTNCASNASTPAVAEFSTSPLQECSVPTNLTTTNITENSATLNWSASSQASSYMVEYKESAGSTWTLAIASTVATSYSIAGLNASTNYVWRVTSNCSNGNSAAVQATFTTSAAPLPACVTNFEPNESSEAAISLSSGVAISAAVGSTTDVDFYAIDLTTTSDLTINLVGPTDADLDVFVYNSSNAQIGAGQTAGSTETVTISALPAGAYTIKVVGANGAFSYNCYSLKATAVAVVVPPTTCRSAYDNATNGTLSGAVAIPFNTTFNGMIEVRGDLDFYKFVISSFGSASVYLSNLPKDYDLRIYNSSGSQIAVSMNSSQAPELITRNYYPGTYYIRVNGYNGSNSSTACYSLKVTSSVGALQEIGIEEAPATTLEIFPNPVINQLHIRSKAFQSSSAGYEILNAKGAKVQVGKLVGQQTSVSVEKLPAGIYYFKLFDGQKQYTRKFLKM